MGIKLSGLREALSALLTDIFHLRTVGGIDKRITGENLSNSLVTDEVLVTSTSSIDLSSYLGNLVIRLGGGSTITFSGYLRAGRVLTLINSEDSTKTLAGTVSGGTIVYLEVRMMVSTGTAFYEFMSSIGGNRKTDQNLRSIDQVTFNQATLTGLNGDAVLTGTTNRTVADVYNFLNAFMPDIQGCMVMITGGMSISSSAVNGAVFSHAKKVWTGTSAGWAIVLYGREMSTSGYWAKTLTSYNTATLFYGGSMAIGPLMGVEE